MTLGEHAITHILSVAPTEVPPLNVEGFSLYPVEVPTRSEQEQLLVSLPGYVDFINAAIDTGGRVLVHSLAVSKASIIICAHSTLSPFPFQEGRLILP